jgi:hypothetical protein
MAEPDQDAPTDYALTDAGRAAIARARAAAMDRYVILTEDDGWTYLYCAEHTARSEDYLGAWEGSALEHADMIGAFRAKHERWRH